jgi:predicted oxidoreductase (fatty acid repression mutant protein)
LAATIPTLVPGRVVKIAVAANDDRVWKISFDSLRRAVCRAVVNYEDAKVDARYDRYGTDCEEPGVLFRGDCKQE